MLKKSLSSLVFTLGLLAAPLANATGPSGHDEDLAASPEAKVSHTDSEHAEAGAHEAHKPRHGANLNLLPKAPREIKNATRPGLAALESPAALSMVAGSSVMLKWGPSKDAETYHLQVATDPNFKWLLVNETLFNGNQFEVKDLKSGTQYFWRVAGMKSSSIPEYTKGGFISSSFEAK